jgi:hypothetical protein
VGHDFFPERLNIVFSDLISVIISNRNFEYLCTVSRFSVTRLIGLLLKVIPNFKAIRLPFVLITVTLNTALLKSCVLSDSSILKLVLNIDKTNTMKFIQNNSTQSALCIIYKEKYIEETRDTKFLYTISTNKMHFF